MADYRVDELAQVSGVTVRNIRYYQDRGMLPPPRREGRVGLYSDAHLVRLRLITRLLERGYTAANITELMTAWERGRDLSEVLGLERAVTAYLEEEVPASTDLGSLRALFELPAAESAKPLLAGVLDAAIVEPDAATGGYRVPSPRLLHAAAGLVVAGAPRDAALRLIGQIRGALDEAVREFVLAFAEEILAGREPDWMPTSDEVARYAGLLDRLKPLSTSAASAALAGGFARHVDDILGQFAARFLPQVPLDADPATPA